MRLAGLPLRRQRGSLKRRISLAIPVEGARSTMTTFDPRNPPAWVRQLMSRAHRRQAGDGRGDDGGLGGDMISLGHGTFAAPLPAGWSLHPGRPFTGRIRPREGYAIDYRLDSYEDAPAARGEARILDYLEEMRETVRRPKDALANVLVIVPERDPAGREIVWKRLDPLRGTHVRELELRCRLTEALVPHRAKIGRAVGEWLNLGGFAPDFTVLDRIAHSAALERVNFEDNFLMRVPRDWKVEVESEKDGRKLFAVDEPEDRETIWANSRFVRVPAGADAAEFMAETTASVWEGPLAAERRQWLLRRREDLPEGDALLLTSNEDEEKGERLRRISWTRYGIRDDYLVWAPVHLVTALQYVDEPAQIETEALVDREVRNALLLPPPDADEEKS